MLKAVAFLVLTIVTLNGSARAQDAADGDIRLVDGFTNTSGRVEIYYNGEWGTICDDSFGRRDARVVCTQLGYNDTRPLILPYTPHGNGLILLDDLDCIGNETSLTECRHRPWGEHNCNHREDAGVECDGLSFADDLRLNGPGRGGRLEVRYGGSWGPVCAYGFVQSNAMVACRTLGFEVKSPQVTFTYGRVRRYVMLADVHCYGNESSLSQCYFRGPFNLDRYCYRGNQVGLNCLDIDETTVSEMEVRLNGGSDVSGRVELSLGGIWGTVCNDGFDNNAAKVVCRALNLPNENAVAYDFYLTHQRLDPVEIWMDDVHCNGTEQSLMDCQHSNLTEHNCRHSEDVGVYCTDNAHAGHHHEIRLAGTNSTESSGRVEVEIYGIWGTVCDDGWRRSNTRVVCRSLNLPYENAIRSHISHYGSGTGPTWLDEVDCGGSEHSLFDCEHEQLGMEECGHNEDVAVICQ